MDFGWALRALGNGQKVARDGWQDKNLYLELHRGIEDKDDENFELESFVMIRTGTWTYEPWTPSQRDMLSGDWELV